VTAALSFEGVAVRYPTSKEPVVEDLSCSLQEGERVALLGLNGSGKTTLLRSVVGLLPHDGTIEVYGTEVNPRSLGTVRAHVGFLFNVPEDQLLFPNVLDDVAFGLRRRGTDKKDASDQARDVLRQLGIADLAGRLVYDLSHGQKLRVALAGVLAAEPAVLLLDEPTAGLDPPACRQLARMLTRQRAAILVATHDLPFAEQLCSRYVVLERGRIAYNGTEVDLVRRMWGVSP